MNESRGRTRNRSRHRGRDLRWGGWVLAGAMIAALGQVQAETLSDQLARQSPWSGTWKDLFGGKSGTMELVFTVEAGSLAGVIRNASAANLDGALTDLEIDGQSVGFGTDGGSAYSLELQDGKLQGTGVTAGGGAFDVVLTPSGS